MHRFLRSLLRVIRAPLRALWWLVRLSLRGVQAANRFMQTAPGERPLSDVFADLAQNSQSREDFWEQVESLRGHLRRAVLGIVIGVGISFAFTQRLANFLTAPVVDPVKMGLVMLPMSWLYFISIALSYIADSGRHRRGQDAAIA